MTREEAIERLNIHKSTNVFVDSIAEAIDMAIKALSAEEAVWNEYEAEFTDLPDIPRYYYEKVVGKMAHEINMLKEQLESADAEPYMQQSRHDDGRMTKEQAVKWVKFVHDVLYEDKDEEIREALGMAIEALLTKPHNYCEVVRCKDCRWYKNRYGEVCHNPRYGDGHANYSPPYIDEEYFCKDGERREE